MNPSPANSPETDAIEQQAAAWVLRLDRGLSATEQDEYSQWLAADPRHGESIALHRWGWDELDRLAGLQASVHARPDPDLLAPGHSEWATAGRNPFHGEWAAAGRNPFVGRVFRFAPYALAAAAIVVLGLFLWGPRRTAPAATPSYALAAPIEQRKLEDGSTVELNRGAMIETVFTATERRVRLVRGEANFIVAKNPDRPFIVSASGVEVRAVGTIFNVRLGDKAVEVLVTEGKVRVAGSREQGAHSTGSGLAGSGEPGQTDSDVHTMLAAGESAVVPLGAVAVAPAVATLNQAEIDRHLAWQPRLLDFTDAPLGEIVGEFNRRNPVQLVIGDSVLGSLKLSATFRSDNVEGFVRLMESDFGMRAEWHGEAEIVLRKAR